jgi:hypothetical protein
MLRRKASWCAVSNEHVNLETNQFVRQSRKAIVPTLCPSELNDDVFAFNVAVVTKSRSKCLNPACPSCSGGGAQEPNAKDLFGLLSEDGTRPDNGCACKKGDKLTPALWRSRCSASNLKLLELRTFGQLRN